MQTDVRRISDYDIEATIGKDLAKPRVPKEEVGVGEEVDVGEVDLVSLGFELLFNVLLDARSERLLLVVVVLAVVRDEEVVEAQTRGVVLVVDKEEAAVRLL